VDFSEGRTLLNGEDVSGLIRTPEISAITSPSSGVPAVRYKLTALQQAMGKRKSIVMDGRDIGTVVFPDADFKFYLTASADERARRRTAEMRAKGEEADFETIRADIIQRLLAFEIMIEGTLRSARRLDDIVHGRPVVTLFVEQFPGR